MKEESESDENIIDDDLKLHSNDGIHDASSEEEESDDLSVKASPKEQKAEEEETADKYLVDSHHTIDNDEALSLENDADKRADEENEILPEDEIPMENISVEEEIDKSQEIEVEDVNETHETIIADVKGDNATPYYEDSHSFESQAEEKSFEIPQDVPTLIQKIEAMVQRDSFATKTPAPPLTDIPAMIEAIEKIIHDAGITREKVKESTIDQAPELIIRKRWNTAGGWIRRELRPFDLDLIDP